MLPQTTRLPLSAFTEVRIRTHSFLLPFAGELRMVGISNPEKIATISVRNDAAFLFAVVGTTSVAAVVSGLWIRAAVGGWLAEASLT